MENEKNILRYEDNNAVVELKLDPALFLYIRHRATLLNITFDEYIEKVMLADAFDKFKTVEIKPEPYNPWSITYRDGTSNNNHTNIAPKVLNFENDIRLQRLLKSAGEDT